MGDTSSRPFGTIIRSSPWSDALRPRAACRHTPTSRGSRSTFPNVLDASRELQPKRFIFASSAAVCDFTEQGRRLTKGSPPDGKNTHATTKRLGEEMLAERRFSQGFLPGEITRRIEALKDTCVSVLLEDDEAADLEHEIQEQIGMATLFGRDQIEESFESIFEAHREVGRG